MDNLDTALATPGVVGTTNRAAARRCKVGRVLDAVTDTQRAAILDRLNADSPSTGWTDVALAQALERGGRYVSASQLSRHRTRGCICTTHDDDNDTNEAR